MKPSDSERFRACLLAMSEVYGREVSSSVATIWWQALQRFDFDAVETAFQRHVTNPDVGQFMPKPADIVRMLEGTSIDSAHVAWAKVDKAVRTIGPYASVTFDDAIIQRVVHDMGGWIGLGQKTDDEWPFVANEFRTRYVGYRGKGETPEYPPVLVGIAEADNVRRGKPRAECVLIGDPAKAEAVRTGGIERPAVGFQRLAPTRVLQLVETKGSA